MRRLGSDAECSVSGFVSLGNGIFQLDVSPLLRVCAQCGGRPVTKVDYTTLRTSH